MTDEHALDRIAITEMIHLYAEAVDILGTNPVTSDDPDPALEQAAHLFGQCLADDAKVRLYFEGPHSPATHAPSDGPLEFARFVRVYFTEYRYVGTYHLAGNIRIQFTGSHTADVTSLINSTHWLADGRMLLAPIHYRDKAVRDGADWKIAERELVVQRWWVTDGYFPDPTDSSLVRPKNHA